MDMPRVCRRSSSSSGLVGSAVATVIVAPSTAIGQARYWRRYLGDSSLTRGGVDGSSSAERNAISCWTATAWSTSVALPAPHPPPVAPMPPPPPVPPPPPPPHT